jgi:hypothetical protein
MNRAAGWAAGKIADVFRFEQIVVRFTGCKREPNRGRSLVLIGMRSGRRSARQVSDLIDLDGVPRTRRFTF